MEIESEKPIFNIQGLEDTGTLVITINRLELVPKIRKELNEAINSIKEKNKLTNGLLDEEEKSLHQIADKLNDIVIKLDLFN